MDTRYKQVAWGKHGTRKLTSPSNRKKPYAWNKDAESKDIHYRVFAQSLSDTFEDRDELLPWRIELFEMIVATPHLDWLVLTKRPEVAKQFFEQYPQFSNLPNVWLGVSVENQEQADIRIPILLEISARIHWLSCEPLLSDIDLEPYLYPKISCICKKCGEVSVTDNYGNEYAGMYCPQCEEHIDIEITECIDWVVVGGESGHNARPLHPDWARSIRNQCADAGVPFLFKQWGEFAPYHSLQCNEEGLKNKIWIQLDPDTSVCKVGKHQAGRLLDGREYSGFPSI